MRHPDITIELELSNVSADLLEQQVDISVRMFPPKQAALIAKKVGSIGMGFYAHAEYLMRHGTPQTLADLAVHRLIGPDRARADLALAASLMPGVDRRAFVLRTDSHPAVLSAARAGAGIAVIQCPVADSNPHLCRVLPDVEVATLDTWIVTHENLRDVGRVRAVFDHLVEEFTAFQRS